MLTQILYSTHDIVVANESRQKLTSFDAEDDILMSLRTVMILMMLWTFGRECYKMAGKLQYIDQSFTVTFLHKLPET